MTTHLVAQLAHQGGWDEALMLLGPIVLIVGLLRLAKSRTRARIRELSENQPHPAAGAAQQRSTSAPNDDSRPTRSS